MCVCVTFRLSPWLPSTLISPFHVILRKGRERTRSCYWCITADPWPFRRDSEGSFRSDVRFGRDAFERSPRRPFFWDAQIPLYKKKTPAAVRPHSEEANRLPSAFPSGEEGGKKPNQGEELANLESLAWNTISFLPSFPASPPPRG